MSAVEIFRMARENGIHIGIEGADLILDAEREPTSRGIVTLIAFTAKS
jgi:hypothetical protein